MKKLIALLILAGLTITVTAKEWHIYSPEYLDPEIYTYNDDNIKHISVYTYETYDDLNDYRDSFREEGDEAGRVLGFSTHGENKCSIFVVMPESWNDKEKMQTMGHELLHCFGADHKGEVI